MALTWLKEFIQSTLLVKAATQQQTSSSSGWFVANTSTKTAETDIDNPAVVALTYGDGTTSKVRVLECKGKAFIDLAHLYVGTDPAAALSVRAFGFWPLSEDKGTAEPYQISSSFPAVSADHIGGGFWAPLYKPEPSGAHEQTFDVTPDVEVDDASPNYKLKGGVSYATAGCTRAVILISTAVANPTVACLIARTGN